ncbi:transcription antitermination factor NusG [Polaribacter sp. Hel1_33_96]|jgi:transcription antitermination factor NusG|uniref:UpxY family transcription antiterminator n=1 Tax=Polaribacter sp. Hel1_33_96 TaxID=1336805 RepID=UPI000C710275|nr:UpxY family transcription antiterminator [Polaribacter sp. Hel1_33_96]PKV65429.1 transcription antitermination factor NusG [Polaribacter sp. Hel1_33_96]
MNWFVIYTKSRQEKKVALELEKMGITVYCPMINQIRQWSDRKKKVEVPLMSSYVFVQLKERDREAVFEVPGIVRYVYWLEKPAIVRDEEIVVMKAWLSNQTVEAKVEGLRRGDRMKVSSGVFEGKEGFVEEISKNRVLLLLPDLGMKITLNRNL